MTAKLPRLRGAGDRRWLMLVVLFIARTAMGFQFQSIASSAPFLIRDFGIGYAEIGTLIGLYMFPGVVIALPGGIVSRRFGDRSICAAGLVLMIVGGIGIATSSGYGAAVLGRTTSGVGAVLFNLVLTKMVTDWFAAREIVTAMGIILASWPFGIAVGLITNGTILAAAGWHSVMFAAAALCGAGLVLVVGLYRAPAAAVRAGAEITAYRGPGSLPPRNAVLVALAGLIWGIFNVGVVLFFSFVPPLLVEHGHPFIEADRLTSIGLWVSMATLPVGGYLAERTGRPDRAIFLFSAGAGAALLLLIVLPIPASLCALFGILLGPPAGGIMALPARALGAANRAVGLGVFYTAYYVVMTAGPPIAGHVRDGRGTAAAVAFGGALFLSVPPLLALFLKLIATAPAPKKG
jgi:predicted MFS family arabinose efflux permease